MVKDIKEQDTLGLLSKGEQFIEPTSLCTASIFTHLFNITSSVSEFDHDLLVTCTVGAMGLLEDGHLSKEALIGETKLFVKDPKVSC